MRLTELQIQQLHEVLRGFLKTVNYKLFLYGSRLHDNLKGGDIDLLVITTDEGVERFSEFHLDLLVSIKKKPAIGQRRIDIKATTSSDLLVDPFLKMIKDEMIEI